MEMAEGLLSGALSLQESIHHDASAPVEANDSLFPEQLEAKLETSLSVLKWVRQAPRDQTSPAVLHPPGGSIVGSSAALSLNGIQAGVPESKVKKKTKSRARILKPGELTLAVYGADEAVKWERRVMQFIYNTSPVLGARKYNESEWKSSILDSVVGAYLTQNVTDALSSKAFMTLAATFPAPDHPDCPDSVAWNAVRIAEIEKLADAIRCRGMYNSLTVRIKEMLRRVRKEGRTLHKPLDVMLPAPKRRRTDQSLPTGRGSARGGNFQAVEIPGVRSVPAVSFTPGSSSLPAFQPDTNGVPISSSLPPVWKPRPAAVPSSEEQFRSDVLDSADPAMFLGLEASNMFAPQGPDDLAIGIDPEQIRRRLEKPSSGFLVEEHLLEEFDRLVEGEQWEQPVNGVDPISMGLSEPESQEGLLRHILQHIRDADRASELEHPCEAVIQDVAADDELYSQGHEKETVIAEREDSLALEVTNAGINGRTDRADGSSSEMSASTRQGGIIAAQGSTLTGEVTIPQQHQLLDHPVGTGLELPGSPSSDVLVDPPCAPNQEIVAGDQEDDRELHPLDLEWLKSEDPDEVRDHLMSFAGLGRKSVACIMLLALGMKDFPVDTNVGRICARLGWLPLDAEKALEDLDDYAPEPEVHQYLKDRMMRFDVSVLYELHYLMITMGKVFCSKKDPNCSACPMRGSCEYALNDGKRRKEQAQQGGAFHEGKTENPQSSSEPLCLEQATPDFKLQEQVVQGPFLDPRPSGLPGVMVDAPDEVKLAQKQHPEIAPQPGIVTNLLDQFNTTAYQDPADEGMAAHQTSGALCEGSPNTNHDQLQRSDSLGDEDTGAGPLSKGVAFSPDCYPSAAFPTDCQPSAAFPPGLGWLGARLGLEAGVLNPPEKSSSPIDEPDTPQIAERSKCRLSSAKNAPTSLSSRPIAEVSAIKDTSPSAFDSSLSTPGCMDMEDLLDDSPPNRLRDSAKEISRVLAAYKAFQNAVREPEVPQEDADQVSGSRGGFKKALRVLGMGLGEAVGESPGSSMPEARKRYLQLSIQLHPDKNPSLEAQQAFDAIRSAWSHLSTNYAQNSPGPDSSKPFQPLVHHLNSGPYRKAVWARELPAEIAAMLGFPETLWSKPSPPCLLIEVPESVRFHSQQSVLNRQNRMTLAPVPLEETTATTSKPHTPGIVSTPGLVDGGQVTDPGRVAIDNVQSASGQGDDCTLGTKDQQSRRARQRGNLQQPSSPGHCTRGTSDRLDTLGFVDSSPSIVAEEHSKHDSAEPQDCLAIYPRDQSAENESGPLLSRILASVTRVANNLTAGFMSCKQSETTAHGAEVEVETQKTGNGENPSDAHLLPSNANVSKGNLSQQASSRPLPEALAFPPAAESSPQAPGAVGAELSGSDRPEVSKQKYIVLVPCRQAMKGRFPLHGTYFQTNEVFFDGCDSLFSKLQCTKAEMQSWKRKQVLFGSSIGSISRGMNQQEVSYLFKHACICVRAYNPKTRLPMPLPGWLDPNNVRTAVPASPRRYVKRARLSQLPMQKKPDKPKPIQKQFRAKYSANGLRTWTARRLRTSLQKRRLALHAEKPNFVDKSKAAKQPRGTTVYRKRSRDDSSDQEGLVGRKRQQVFPKITASERCGHCKSCLNRSLKKACYTRRAELVAAMKAEMLG